MKEDVLRIRRMLKDGYSNKYLAELFGVSAPHISHIKHRKTWKSV